MNFPDRILTPKEVVSMTTLSLSSIDRKEKAGLFPRRIQLGTNKVGYRLSEVMQWIDGCIASPIQAKPVAPGSRKGRRPKTASVVVGG